MNQYLLLRDNKQTGPFSADQLREMGLKPYDLVWQDGKSAAWRYPSELPELQAFAPVVEEQPYDRFYKKPSASKQETPVGEKSMPIVNDELPSDKPFQPKPLTSKSTGKVFVTLPSTEKNRDATLIGSIPKEAVARNSENSTPEISAPRFKVVKTTRAPVFPDVSDKNAVSNHPDIPAKSGGELNQSFIGSLKNSINNQYSLLAKGLIAASLLLGGVLIGLFFSSRKQANNMQELNALVKQIQDRNATTSTAKSDGVLPTNDNFFNQVSSEHDTNMESSPNPFISEDLDTPVEPDKPVIKKSLASDDSDSDKLEEVKNPNTNVSAAVHQEDEPVVRKPVISEAQKKNLFQLVSVRNNDYKTGVLGGINGLTLTLTNKSSYQLENVEVEIKYLSPEKRVVRSQTVAFHNVSPGAEMYLDIPKSSRGVSIDYTVRKIRSPELGVSYASLSDRN